MTDTTMTYRYEVDDDGHVYLEPGTDPLESDELSPHVAKMNVSREDWQAHAAMFLPRRSRWPERTHSVIVKTRRTLEAIVLAFIPHSQWFAVEPRPDDEYEITVKEENQHILDALCEP